MEEVDKNLVCETCYEILDTEELLKEHQMLCAERKPANCGKCKAVFEDHCGLLDHQCDSGPTVSNGSEANSGEETNAHNGFRFSVSNKDEVTKTEFTSEVMDRKPLLCGQCFQVFYTKDDLDDHILDAHTDNELLICDVCCLCFHDVDSYDAHRETHENEGLHMCNICGDEFTLEDDLKEHILSHGYEINRSTVNGRKNANSESELQPYKCASCKESFSCSSDLDDHAVKCNAEYLKREFKEINGKEHQSTELGSDRISSKPVLPHQCNLCEKSFKTKSKLASHLLTHSGEKPVQCDLCDKSFRDKSHLTQHKRVHTGEKPYHCHICKKSFSMGSHLKTHIMTHSGERPFKCEQCGKAFRSRSHLKVHIRIHSGTKPYRCDQCDKAFVSSSHLTEHKRIHSGERPYQCFLCVKSFKNSSHLTEHLRTHSGAKPFKCDQCDKSFRSTSHLVDHKRSHSGARPFQCNQCDKTFGRKSHLNYHLRVHSGIKPFKCPYCDKAFITNSKMNQHAQSQHRDEILASVKLDLNYENEEKLPESSLQFTALASGNSSEEAIEIVDTEDNSNEKDEKSFQNYLAGCGFNQKGSKAVFSLKGSSAVDSNEVKDKRSTTNGILDSENFSEELDEI